MFRHWRVARLRRRLARLELELQAENLPSREVARQFSEAYRKIKRRHGFRPFRPTRLPARRGPGLAAHDALNKQKLRHLRSAIARVRAGFGHLHGHTRIWRPLDLDYTALPEQPEVQGGGRLSEGQRLTVFRLTPPRFTPLKFKEDPKGAYSGGGEGVSDTEDAYGHALDPDESNFDTEDAYEHAYNHAHDHAHDHDESNFEEHEHENESDALNINEINVPHETQNKKNKAK